MAKWSGKSRGGEFGYKFFIYLLKYTNIKLTYFFLRFVAFYFLFASDKSAIRFYFTEILNYKGVKVIISIYKNYYLLGQVLIDKVAVLAGVSSKFTFDFDGESHLRKMVEDNNGGLLLGAHMGNWEVAGQLLKRLDVKINVVMYEAEHEKIKALIDKNTVESNTNIIAIKNDFTHITAIQEAFENNELVVMHADRFVKGTNTAVMDFMNHKAEFSTSPIYLASKHNVPVSYVYALKESSTHYHFFASEGKYYKYPSKIKQRKEDLKIMLQDYTNSLETIINKYPLQWFNYYPFWENQK